jgi:hypothetical protein
MFKIFPRLSLVAGAFSHFGKTVKENTAETALIFFLYAAAIFGAGSLFMLIINSGIIIGSLLMILLIPLLLLSFYSVLTPVFNGLPAESKNIIPSLPLFGKTLLILFLSRAFSLVYAAIVSALFRYFGVNDVILTVNMAVTFYLVLFCNFCIIEFSMKTKLEPAFKNVKNVFVKNKIIVLGIPIVLTFIIKYKLTTLIVLMFGIATSGHLVKFFGIVLFLLADALILAGYIVLKRNTESRDNGDFGTLTADTPAEEKTETQKNIE